MITLYSFTLPLQTPLKTGAGKIVSREGIVIRFRHDGHDLIAEASPLPGFSIESIRSLTSYLNSRKHEISEFLSKPFSADGLNQFIVQHRKFPSLQFAISILGWKLMKQSGRSEAGRPLFPEPAASVTVNEIIGHDSPDRMRHRINAAIQDGFKTIKIKTPAPDPGLASLLKEIHNQYNDIQFRLDANRNWNPGSFTLLNNHFKNLPIQYIEEPYAVQNSQEIRQIQRLSPYPIALDESIPGLHGLKRWLKLHPDLYVIIKPTVLGNIFEISETLSEIRSNYKRVVITTSLESAVGREAISLIAASIGDRALAHGLSTGRLFRKDLYPSRTMKNGILELNEDSGTPLQYTRLDPSMLTLLT